MTGLGALLLVGIWWLFAIPSAMLIGALLREPQPPVRRTLPSGAVQVRVGNAPAVVSVRPVWARDV